MAIKVDQYLKLPYARVLIPDEKGSFAAEILEFPGCFSQGQTADEAMQNLEKAALAWIESSLAQGQEIPAPSITQGYGGKIALRLPRSIHRRATELAERDGTSLNQFLLSAIAARIGAEDLYARFVKHMEERITAANVAVKILSVYPEWIKPGALPGQQTPPTARFEQFELCVAGTKQTLGEVL